jgi:hypothetical protein
MPEQQKCIFSGCVNTGTPEPGFDFYACDGCLLKLESSLKARAAAKDRADSTAVIRLPLNNKTEYAVTQKDVAYWSEMFPAIDVMQHLRKMHTWLDANPRNRKTRGGIRAFIARWLAEEQDKAPRVQGAPAAKMAPAGPVWDLPAGLGQEQLAKSIWRDALEALRAPRLNGPNVPGNRPTSIVSPNSFDTWLKPTRAVGMRDGVLYVTVPSLEFLCIQEKFGEQIRAQLPHAVTSIKFVAPKETA